MKNQVLWYNTEAKTWVEALPIGNGQMAALMFGNPTKERIALNIANLWSGDGRDKANVNQNIDWDAIREPIKKGQYQEAEELIKEKVLGDWTECFLPAGDVYISMEGVIKNPQKYVRRLDLSDAIYSEEYRDTKMCYEKEAFCDYNSKVLLVKYKGEHLNGNISINSQLEYTVEADSNMLLLKGRAPHYAAPIYYECEKPIQYDGDSMDYEIKVMAEGVDHTGQKIKLSPSDDGKAICFYDLNEITIYIYGETNFATEGADTFISKDKDIRSAIDAKLSDIISGDYYEIKNKHASIYKSFFDHVKLSIGEDTETDTLTRILDFKRGKNDNGLVNLLFNYGKYLLISSSCPGGEAANLQGIWNVEVRAPWSSNYTVNINTEMNYWPSEVLGLSENHEPMFTLLKRMEKKGTKVAKDMYHVDGWVTHHNVDIWGHATPVGYYAPRADCCTYGMWNMSGAWMCRHLYDHYAFTGDEEFLRETAIPITEGAVRFFLSWLVEEDGRLLTMPSTSPENQFFYDSNKRAATTMGSTMDMSIVRELFLNYIKLCDSANIENKIKQECRNALPKLPEYKIGKNGQLQEWYKDYDETDINHRHVSHLYGLYPSDTIKETDIDLRKACEITLNRRGDDGTGWCIAWKAALWARLLNGNRAWDLLKNQMRFTDVEYTSSKGGGIYTNLFCAHPPFQIDGNFGYIAAVCEMLIQSQEDYTRILPALPDEWSNGSVEGIRGRGGYTYCFSWENRKVIRLCIKAQKAGKLKLIVNGEQKTIDFASNLEITVI